MKAMPLILICLLKRSWCLLGKNQLYTKTKKPAIAGFFVFELKE